MEVPNPLVREKQDQIRSSVITAVSLLLMLVPTFFVRCGFEEIDAPEKLVYGMEVNFGYDSEGSGDRKSENRANENDSFEDSQAGSQQQPQPQPEQTQPETPQETQTDQPQPEPDQPAEPIEETPADTEPVVDEAEEAIEVPETTPEETKPDPALDQPEEKPEETKPVQPDQPETKPEEKPEEKPKEPEKPSVNEDALLGPGTGSGGGNSSEAQASNDGTGTTTGNQGKETGTNASDSYTGNSTGGGNAYLSIVGWTWKDQPADRDQSDAYGQVAIRFTIDEEGVVIDAQVIEEKTTLNDRTAIEFYRRQVMQKATFKREANAKGEPPTRTRGLVVYTIKRK